MAELLREPLRHLFLQLVEKNYSSIGLRDAYLTHYVAGMLEEFASTRQLYRLRSAAGKPLETVAEMLSSSNPISSSGGNAHGDAGEAGSREREVRQHVGDFALFFTGMFPESLNRSRRRHALLLGANYFADTLLDYVAAGKESYRMVSDYERSQATEPSRQAAEAGGCTERQETRGSGPYAGVLFAMLASEFERCMHGLNCLKSELESFQDPIYMEARKIMGGDLA